MALDVDDLTAVDSLVGSVSPFVGGFKVGKELMYSVGAPVAVTYVQQRGGGVFMDGKFHDIPETVAKTCRAAVRLQPKMFNIHCLGGFEMMQAATQAVKDEAAKLGLPVPLLIGVTILTSHDKSSLTELGFDTAIGVSGLVVQLAVLAQKAGLDGVVSSPREIEDIRSECGKDFVIVTPGIRAEGSKPDDQKRKATAREAVSWGATYIVVGRPITQDPSPVDAAKRIADEVDAVAA